MQKGNKKIKDLPSTIFSFRKNGAGFTLIEILVVITIFSILIAAVVGIFVSVIRIQRYYLASQQLLNQTSYAMEYMSRFIRMAQKADDNTCISTGTNYQLSDSLTGLKFLNYHGECQEFSLSNGQIYQNFPKIPGSALALTSDELEVTEFNFYVNGESENDEIQPRVTIYLEAEAVNASPRPKIRLQTTVSQRELDID